MPWNRGVIRGFRININTVARWRDHWVITYAYFKEWLQRIWYVTSTAFTDGHDDVIKWRHFPRYWPFVWGIHRLQSPASRLFTQLLIQTQIKENIKASRHWPLWGEFITTGEFPAQKASNAENVFIWWRHHVFEVFVRIPWHDDVLRRFLTDTRTVLLHCAIFAQTPWHHDVLRVIHTHTMDATHYV